MILFPSLQTEEIYAVTFNKNIADELTKYNANKILYINNEELSNYNPQYFLSAFEQLNSKYSPKIFINNRRKKMRIKSDSWGHLATPI